MRGLARGVQLRIFFMFFWVVSAFGIIFLCFRDMRLRVIFRVFII